MTTDSKAWDHKPMTPDEITARIEGVRKELGDSATSATEELLSRPDLCHNLNEAQLDIVVRVLQDA